MSCLVTALICCRLVAFLHWTGQHGLCIRMDTEDRKSLVVRRSLPRARVFLLGSLCTGRAIRWSGNCLFAFLSEAGEMVCHPVVTASGVGHQTMLLIESRALVMASSTGGTGCSDVYPDLLTGSPQGPRSRIASSLKLTILWSDLCLAGVVLDKYCCVLETSAVPDKD